MLELRQMSEEVLDNFGLGELHVGVNPNLRTLALMGECGKELVNINGIKLDRLTKNSREYALELLERFLNKHGKVISDYINDKKTLVEVERPDDEIRVDNIKFILKYDSVAKKTYIDCYNAMNVPMETLKELATNKTSEIKDIEEKIIEFLKYREKVVELKNKLSEISKCDI